MYSKQIKYTQIHLYMKNLLKTLFVHYIYISNYIKRGLSTHFMRTFRNHDGGRNVRLLYPLSDHAVV